MLCENEKFELSPSRSYSNPVVGFVREIGNVPLFPYLPYLPFSRFEGGYLRSYRITLSKSVRQCVQTLSGKRLLCISLHQIFDLYKPKFIYVGT